MTIENTLFRGKPARLLIYMLDTEMQPKTMSTIAKRTDCFFSHIQKLVIKYAEAGLMVKEKRGRTCYLSLTTKGGIIATELKKIYDKLGIENG